jgi:hypothetical protein
MQVDPERPLRLAAKLLEDIKHLKVSNSNPPTSTNEALDVDRCSALHNAIIKYQWEASGRDLAALSQKTWWDSEQFADQLDEVGKNLPECLVEFLQRALHPKTHLAPDIPAGNMFYLSPGLAAPQTLWRELGEEMGDGYRVALYLTDYEISDPTIDGIVYDLDDHCCVFNSYSYNEFLEEENAPIWQYLETVPTAWINMIERQKAVVVRDLSTNKDTHATSNAILSSIIA